VKRANLSLSLALIVCIGLVCGNRQLCAQAQKPSPQPWKQIPIPKLPAFHPQQPKRIELPNGMVVFLQEDHELPMIDGTARIRGGERSVPANKTGLMDVYGEVWRTGGTKSQTGDQLDDYLEQRAAKVETGGSSDSTTVSWSCLKEDFDDVFKVFADLLRNPEFRADKIEIAQKGMYDGISRRNDDPSQIAGREAAKLAYGADNPYAREPEYATVAAITRQDLVEWHGKYVHPNNIILGVVGDFDSAKMEGASARGLRGVALGRGGDRSRNQARTSQAGILPGRQDRRKSKQHSNGGARHHAQESRLLCSLGVQRSFRRWIFVPLV